MNWEAIGAVGEVSGALLVGVTLIYLAIQDPVANRAAREISRLVRRVSSHTEIRCPFHPAVM